MKHFAISASVCAAKCSWKGDKHSAGGGSDWDAAICTDKEGTSPAN